MAGHKPFSELVAKMPRKAQLDIKGGTAKILAEMELAELREALKVRQADLALKLKTTQAAVSRLERRENMTVSSLRNFIEALGGKLELNAVLPNQIVKIAYAFHNNVDHAEENAVPSKKKSVGKDRGKRKVSRARLSRVQV